MMLARLVEHVNFLCSSVAKSCNKGLSSWQQLVNGNYSAKVSPKMDFDNAYKDFMKGVSKGSLLPRVPIPRVDLDHLQTNGWSEEARRIDASVASKKTQITNEGSAIASASPIPVEASSVKDRWMASFGGMKQSLNQNTRQPDNATSGLFSPPTKNLSIVTEKKDLLAAADSIGGTASDTNFGQASSISHLLLSSMPRPLPMPQFIAATQQHYQANHALLPSASLSPCNLPWPTYSVTTQQQSAVMSPSPLPSWDHAPTACNPAEIHVATTLISISRYWHPPRQLVEEDDERGRWRAHASIRGCEAMLIKLEGDRSVRKFELPLRNMYGEALWTQQRERMTSQHIEPLWRLDVMLQLPDWIKATVVDPQGKAYHVTIPGEQHQHQQR